MLERVVIATDGSRSVKRAEGVGIDLADRFDATLHALYVVDLEEVAAAPQRLRDEYRTELNRRGTEALDDLRDRTDRPVVTSIREGRPVTEINAFVEEQDADLVTLGTRGRHGEDRLLIGSVSEQVVRTCPVPVLTVRHLDEAT